MYMFMKGKAINPSSGVGRRLFTSVSNQIRLTRQGNAGTDTRFETGRRKAFPAFIYLFTVTFLSGLPDLTFPIQDQNDFPDFDAVFPKHCQVG